MDEPKEAIDKIIKVTLTTRERLKHEGMKGETYEDVITRMFAEVDSYRMAET